MRNGVKTGELLYVSDCTFARNLSTDEYEQLYEVTFWPHGDDDEDDDCPHLDAALATIGAWAPWAVPLDTVTDLLTGAVSMVITPIE